MNTTLEQQQAHPAIRTTPMESDSAQLSLLMRAAAALLQRAHTQLQEALGSSATQRAEVIEQAAFEIETNVMTALSLTRHADDLHMELRASDGVTYGVSSLSVDDDKYLRSEETIRRLVGNARQIEIDLNAAVRSLPPTRRQLAAADQLLKQVRAPSALS